MSTQATLTPPEMAAMLRAQRAEVVEQLRQLDETRAKAIATIARIDLHLAAATALDAATRRALGKGGGHGQG